MQVSKWSGTLDCRAAAINERRFVSSSHLAGGDIMGRMCGLGACDVSGRCAEPGSSVGRAGEYGPESGGSTTAGRGGRAGESGGNVSGIL